MGKWHLGNDPRHGPIGQGFDLNVGGYEAGSPRSYFSPYKNPELKDGPKGEYLTDRLTEEALMFIEANRDKPFFLYLPHYAPVEYVGEEQVYPFVLNIVTLMSLGPYSAAANLPSLQEISGMTVGERWDSWLEMNPETAHELGLHDKDRVWVESPFGKLETKVRFVKALRPDVVNLPYNQGHTAVGRWAKNRGVNGLEILNPATEPLSGLAAFTNTRVKVYRV